MDISSLIFSLALLILVVLYVVQPLIIAPSSEESLTNSEMSSLMAERERILEAIKELDFDNSMGKVPEELYPNQRENLVRRGAEVLRKLDEFKDDDDQTELDLPNIPEVSNPSSIDEKIEELVTSRKSMREHSSTQFCQNCGKSVQQSDKFCTHCGTPVT